MGAVLGLLCWCDAQWCLPAQLTAYASSVAVVMVSGAVSVHLLLAVAACALKNVGWATIL
jgi:hypothetical protein